MWECQNCGTKNNNSSQKCHGNKCKGIRSQVAMELPTKVIKAKQIMDETVYDWCSVCQKDQYFTKVGRTNLRMRYKCHGCHKPFVKIGKNKPKPQEVFT
jgi:hypothetical protein